MRNLVILLFALTTIVSCSCSSGSQDNGPDTAKAENEQVVDKPNDSYELVLTGDDSTSALLEQGQNLEKQLLFYDALYQYLLVKKASPNFLPAYAGIVRTLMRLDFDEETVRAVEDYAARAGDYSPAHYDLARFYIYLKDYAKAEDHIEKAIQTGMNQATAELLKVRIVALRGDINSARETAGPLLLQKTGSAIYYYEAAEYLESVGLIDSAMILSRKAYAAEDSNFDILFDHFLRAVRNFYMQDARRVMNDMEGKTGVDIFLKGLESRYRGAVNELFATSQATARIKKLSKYCLSANIVDAEVRGPIFDYTVGMDDLNRSFMMVDKEEEIPDFKKLVQYRVAKKYLLLNDYIKARKHFDQMSGWRMKSRDFKLTDIFMLYNTGRFEIFEGRVDTLLDLHGDKPEWLTGIADVYKFKLIHQYDLAEDLYRRALKQDKWYRPAFYNMLDMFRELRQYDKVVKLMKDYPHFERNYPSNVIIKALALVELDRFDEGIKLFKENIGPVKGNISYYEELINIFTRKYEFERAEAIIDFMLEQEPENSDMLVLAAVVNSDLKKYDRAYKLAERALAVEPANLEALVQKAFCTYWRGDKDEGYRLMGKLQKDFFGNKMVNLYASLLNMNDNKEMGKVGNWVRSSLGKGRYCLKSYLNLSDYYFLQERYTFARQCADNVVGLFDNHPKAYYTQGRALFYEKEKPEKARKNLQKAIDLGLKGEELKEAKKMLSEL